jgi:GNAT superfamily N-acetyltransferase
MILEYTQDGFTISTDPARLDVAAIHDFVSTRSYWAQRRPLEVVQTAIAHSLCYGVYDGARQAGFARVVTDYATFAWLCDVFILEDYRGRGLGKWLVTCIVAHPELQHLRRWMLATRDAHTLYARVGFQPLSAPERWMERFDPQPYR